MQLRRRLALVSKRNQRNERQLCGLPQSFRRRLAGLQLAGRVVRISVMARRFRCTLASCRRSIFVERFSDDVLAAMPFEPGRLDGLVHRLALVLGGRPAASLARRLMMPVSNDSAAGRSGSVREEMWVKMLVI